MTVHCIMNRVHPQSIAFYRRLVKTVRKVFMGDTRMIDGLLAEASRLLVTRTQDEGE